MGQEKTARNYPKTDLVKTAQACSEQKMSFPECIFCIHGRFGLAETEKQADRLVPPALAFVRKDARS
jgi:hypothetical protein